MAKALTEVSISKIKPGVARAEVADGLVGGLYLVVQPSGNKSWAIRYRANGVSRKLTLGKYPAVSLASARALAKANLLKVAAGEDPATQKSKARAANADERRHFLAVARKYVAEYQKPKNRTWKEAARQLGLVPPAVPRGEPSTDDIEKFEIRLGSTADRWARRDIDSITTEDVLRELDRQAPVQANRYLNTLRTLWKFAADPRVRLASANPTAGITKPTPETSRPRVLSDVELRSIWRSAEALGQPWAGLVRTLILTGQRRDEVARLPWSELDIERRRWVIPEERAKNGNQHLVHLSPQAVEQFAAQARAGRFVFSRGTTPVTDYSDAKKKLDSASGVADWVFHDFRRTMATRLSELGVASNVVEGLLNHVSGGSKSGVAGVYNRAELEPQRYRAIHSWARYVTLILDERKYEAFLGACAQAEDEYAARLEMAEACLAGGSRWDAWLSNLELPSATNIVSIAKAG
jgi:integrase